MKTIARDTKERFALTAIAITRRLGDVGVGVGEDSVHVAASSPHRRTAFEAATFALEAVKHCAEIWKREVFCDGHGVWRRNRDEAKGVLVDEDAAETAQQGTGLEGCDGYIGWLRDGFLIGLSGPAGDGICR
jgi:hypothetical protein